jgi:alpha-L-rhamnosidase
VSFIPGRRTIRKEAFLLCLAATISAASAMVEPVCLRCEYHANPAAICTTTPRFSWKIRTTDPQARHVTQSAYELEVAREDGNTLWASGKVESFVTDQIEYAGQTLKSRDRAVWRVRVWDGEGRESPWSEQATFAIGLLEQRDWAALWISMADNHTSSTTENVQNFVGDPQRGTLHLTPAKYFRKEFDAPAVSRATLHATALGVYTLEINGRRVSPERLAPGWSAYQRRIHSQTYDVTSFLREGGNAIGGILADGWYSGYVAYGLLTLQEGLVPGIDGRYYYGVSPALRVQLELEFADGTKQTITTDPTWKTSLGTITESDILMGESYDARREMPGWSSPGFDDATWEPAVAQTGTDAPVMPHPGVPVLPIQEIKPVSVRQQEPGRYIFDLGQNISGVIRLKVKGRAGDRVTMRFSEVLHLDGRLSTENLRCARAVNTYTLMGDPSGEEWTPEFTFHGFQYVELTGFPGTPDLDCITGIVMHSDTPLHGEFSCSDPMLNRLYQNILWTQRANFFEIPTDCPQRDERMGWTGDAQIYVRAATCNADIASFFTKWLRDLNDDQWDYGAYPPYAPRPLARPNEHHAAGWMDAGVICPWTIWQVYGDTRVITEHWRKMNDFMSWRLARDPELKGAVDDCGFGDWLSLDEVKTPIPYIDLAYHAYCAKLMAEMAAAIRHKGDAQKYQIRHADASNAFRKHYLQADGKLAIHNQTAYAMALFFELIPEEFQAASAGHLAALVRANGNKLATGFLGTRPLLPVLSAHGHHDVAGILIQQREFPSWGYEVENGATTIWERWNSYIKDKGPHEPAMNSFSHYAFGAVCEWMFADLAGIDRAAPGFDRIRIEPRPTGTLTHVSAAMETRHGRLACAWKLDDGKFTATIIIPSNTTADVILPGKGTITDNGQALAGRPGVISSKGNRAVLGSGIWHLEITR